MALATGQTRHEKRRLSENNCFSLVLCLF